MSLAAVSTWCGRELNFAVSGALTNACASARRTCGRRYFGPEGSDGEHHSGSFNYSNATVSSAVDAFVASVDDMVVETVTFVELAKNLGVKVASYEGGPGYAVGVHPPGSKALDTMIGAARSEGMFEVGCVAAALYAILPTAACAVQFQDLFMCVFVHAECSLR